MSGRPDGRGLPSLTVAAMGSSAVMTCYAVASRAARDTLFLSNFAIHTLPLMVAVASVISIVLAVLAARAMARFGPERVVPAAFLGSAVLTLGEWMLTRRLAAAGAIVVYLHVAAISPLLLSGFWSILNERFDPRTAKSAIGRIAAAGTLGGLVGGVMAERLTAWAGIAGTLPALALAHAWCAWSTSRLSPIGGITGRAEAKPALPAKEAGRRLLAIPYLRNLGLLILGCSTYATLLDFVFKAQASAATRGTLDLMRLFSGFYVVVAVVTFAVQALLARPALERAGLARTIGTLPGGVIAGGIAAIAIPGLWSVTVVRGIEAVLRGSLFRAGYELLYTPIPAAEKRATKALVDVGCDRVGDAVGSGIVVLVLLLVPGGSTVVLLALAVVLAAATLGTVARLRHGYVASLEAGLREGAVDSGDAEVADRTTRVALSALDLGGPSDATLRLPRYTGPPASDMAGTFPRPASPSSVPVEPTRDPAAARLSALHSRDPVRAREALRGATPLDSALVPHVIALLASDDLAPDAVRALVPVAARHTGQLVDALLDPHSDVAVRRRIPSVLLTAPGSRVVDGLSRGLADSRFDVRYRCGRALARILEREPGLHVDRESILTAVQREAAVSRTLWESRRHLEGIEEPGGERFVDDFVRDRAGRSLEHTFTLLSLVLPREPLRIAFRGLHASDPMLRGTALEYLDSVLPPAVREVLWPHLEPERAARPAPRAPRDREQVLNDLLRSNPSIEVNLESLRRRHREEPGPGDGR